MKKIIIFTIYFLTLINKGFAEPKIVASVPVIASIASKISGQNVKYIISNTSDGCVENYSMKPSDIKSMTDADLLILVGKGFEPFYSNIKKLKGDNTNILSISDKIPLLYKETSENDHSHNLDENSNKDYHFWLSPLNGIGIAFEITNYLSKIDPEKASLYQKNFDLFSKELQSVVIEIKGLIKPNKTDYLLSHDALQYFEKYFDIGKALTISSLESGEISIKKAIEIQDIITKNHISSILVIGANLPKGLKNISGNSDIKIKNIDILGTESEFNDNLYFKLLKDIALNIFL